MRRIPCSRGYVGLLMLLVVCAITALWWASTQKTPQDDSTGVTRIQADLKYMQAAQNLHAATDAHNAQINAAIQ